ncbi:MAG: M1 family aminopeptidase, partial [Saprospiraceae bacterium]|nr:M1 family aminopeptidase [Saprospiraceae bacterium]
ILSPVTKPGFANGTLVAESIAADSLWRTWRLDEPIPSYLACFAIGPYTTFRREYPGADNVLIPVEIAAAPTDTNKVRTTFNKLPIALQAYEDWFGPYQWEKIGYSLVPFNSGAMEHATNVAIGRAFIDGSLNFESLWAHELSHHWWGDLATCSTAEDMWLNEGWASYCEHLFAEKAYGKAAFQNAVRSNHLSILQTAHVNEGGYRAVSGLPHSLTYGVHVYNKGASVAHNLRGYMGDSLFRVGCRAALAQTNFEAWSSADFRDKLEAATGLNLHDFFDDWVFAGGYPDFSIDSFQIVFSPIDAPTLVGVKVKQKKRGAPEFHDNVPLEFTFLMSDGQKQYRSGLVSGENTVLQFSFPAFGPAPRLVFVNTNLKILQARSEGERWLKTTGSQNFVDAKWNLSVNSLGGADSVFFRVEHHFAAPDDQGANPNQYALSKRYWSLYGGLPAYAFPPGFDAQATIFYDGRGQADQLDVELFAATSPSEDSVLLLYRPGPGHPWQEWPSYTKITFSSTTDRWGQLRPTQLRAGEYTIGKGVSTLSNRTPQTLGRISLSPNPGNGIVSLRAEKGFSSVILINAEGQTEKSWQYDEAQEAILDVSRLPAGAYWLVLSGKAGSAVQAYIKQ